MRLQRAACRSPAPSLSCAHYRAPHRIRTCHGLFAVRDFAQTNCGRLHRIVYCNAILCRRPAAEFPPVCRRPKKGWISLHSREKYF
ncbi:hypothetical protein GDO78_014154 [Eleutherodactylus coqui]|uniref:Uncharacterized protein n=1 Tax=Eleutherodactylus coqui TaxID=57060 RepID=A0A8J6BCJ0_ELECQ|nr:hypothetical protein GDO78_014154 [Eleutherodactylus coqui]